jgi:hypothetical protein
MDYMIWNLSLLQAAFVPSSESALDTSYFTSRYSWNHSDDHDHPASEPEDSSDADSLSGSSSCLSHRQDEVVLYSRNSLVITIMIELPRLS